MNKTIMKSQKQEVYQWIADYGLEPSMFFWEDFRSRNDDLSETIVSKLKYVDTHYFFIFDFKNDVQHCTFSPGQTVLIQNEFPGTWSGQLRNFDKWLAYLKREIETVDPWDVIDKYMPGMEINLEDEKENSPYSYEQVEHIAKALYRFKDEVKKNYDLDKDQDKLVQEKLDYLIDRSKKMGRIDWKNLFVGTLMGLAGGLALNPEQAKGFWGLVKICFKGILLLGKG